MHNGFNCVGKKTYYVNNGFKYFGVFTYLYHQLPTFMSNLHSFMSKFLIQCSNSSQKSLIHNNTLHRTTGFELAISSARFGLATLARRLELLT